MNGMNMGPMNMGPMNMGNMNNMGTMTGPMGGPMGQGGPMGPMGPACTVFSPNSGPGPKPMPVSAGKIYPPDQAMLCESGCNFWFHRICTGLTEAAYHLLTAEV